MGPKNNLSHLNKFGTVLANSYPVIAYQLKTVT